MPSYNHLSSRSRCCLLLILLTTSPITHAFAPPHTTNSPKAARSILSSYSSDQTNAADEKTPNNNTHNRPSSDLKALLPKPASRPLQLDKFGRRIYRMEDDTTVRHTKGSPSSAADSSDGGGNNDGDVAVNEKIIEGDRSTTSNDYTTTTTSTSPSSNLSNLLSDSKQRAGDKSLTQTFNGVHSSSDLKALLPTAKMRFMKLDKFGRRVQRMEDDGTVSYSRSGVSNSDGSNDEVSESGTGEEVNSIRGVKHSINSQFTSDSEVPPTPPSTTTNPNEEEEEGPSLSELIASPSPTSDLEKDAKTKTGIHGTDLKALLPTTKMRFMKLDKFGRRVQRMEDDGTVSYSRSGNGGVSETSGGVESESMVDLGSEEVVLASASASSSTADSGSSSANLKDLAGTSKRPVFTKLDFKGGSVEDDRRMLSSSSSSSTDPEEEVPSSGLKELALSSKRPIFTKLDFKGGSVEDDRRTNNNKSSSTTAASNNESSTKSNLKELLPKRPTFTKLDFKGGNVEDERRTKTPPSQSLGAPIQSSGSLQTLLPERKFMWKKQERRSTTNDFIGNVGGDFIARTTTSGSGESGRERRKKAMREEVMASASLNAAEEEEGVALDDDNDGSSDGSEGEGSYSNLTDLLPQKKFVFRETRK